jgi:serine phosphatase RsbU (regulator of sigma subunit)
MGASYSLLSVFYLASGVFIFLLGLTILRAGRSSSPSRATALMLFFAGVGPILSATSIILQGSLKEDAVVYRSMVDNFEYLWEFYFPSLLLFALTYPRERGPNFILLGLVLFAPYIAHLLTLMAGNSFPKVFADVSKNLPLGREVSLGGEPLELGGIGNVVSAILGTLVKIHKQLFLLVNLVYATTALVVLARSRRAHINPRTTGQLRTVLMGVTVSVVGYLLAKVAAPMAPPAASEDLSLALINFSLVAGGGSVAYAIVKQQFLGIRYVARKSLLYGAAAFLFAVVYLVVVKPVSDFFGQYSMVSKDAFETGFIILAIIAFQPVLFRTEELLEHLLLKGRDDLQTKFKNLGSELSGVASEAEIEARLDKRLRDILDAGFVRLYVDALQPRFQRLAPVLESIGDPVTRDELATLADKGRLSGFEPAPGARRLGFLGKRRGGGGAEFARTLAGEDEVLVPILKERTLVGYLALGEKAYGLKYTAEELGLLSVISNQIGVALDNIRLLRENVEKKRIEEELELARRIQSQLLPGEAPAIPGYQLTATTIPSRQVGGDLYDFELIGDERLVVIVADVSGKGIPASLLMATLHAAVNSNEDVREKPAAMMQRLNTLLYSRTSPEEFATLFYGVVELKSGVMRYANAGHDYPYVISRDGVSELAESGLVLGYVDVFPYEEKTCTIPPGGCLVLFTDGVTDVSDGDGELFGEIRLRQVLEAGGGATSRDLCAAILGAVRAFSSNGERPDDLTLVVLSRE